MPAALRSGGRSVASWSMSPVWMLLQLLGHRMVACGMHLVCVEDVRGGLEARPRALPTLRTSVFWPDEEVECMVFAISALALSVSSAFFAQLGN